MPLLDATGLLPPSEVAETIPNTVRIDDLTPRLDSLPSIAIAFPGFADGRGFSLARQLRQAGYRGRLRASGELIPDQFAFALDCGFDEVEIGAERLARQPVDQWLTALATVRESYQATARLTDIFTARRAARARAAA